MAKTGYIGVNGIARKGKAMYAGIDGVVRKVKTAYVGVNGVARQWYAAEQPFTFTIGEESYCAASGMTWGDWLNSPYNVDKWGIESDFGELYLVNTAKHIHMLGVIGFDEDYDAIVENRDYKTGRGSSIVYLSDLGVGTAFNFGLYQIESEDPWSIKWKIVYEQSDYKIAQTEQIIDLRCFDAKEVTNPNASRQSNGNNKWAESNIEQFLNSDQANWYSAQHQYDAPPSSANVTCNPYSAHKGFLYYFGADEKSLLQNMTLTLANPSIDGAGSYSWTGKVWLPTVGQMQIDYGSFDSSLTIGSEFFADSNQPFVYASKVKTLHEKCAAYNPLAVQLGYKANDTFNSLLSSKYGTSDDQVGGISQYSALNDNFAPFYANDGAIGIAPCIKIPKDGFIWG